MFNLENTTNNYTIFFDGDPTRPGLTGVGSDVDTGNAEICLVTANSSKEVQITCAYDVQLEFWLILPEATAIGVRLSHASREVQDLGILLSNTWTTYPMEGDNPGKLGIIPHRLWMLECSVAKRSAAIGWVCGRLGSCWGNGPTSL